MKTPGQVLSETLLTTIWNAFWCIIFAAWLSAGEGNIRWIPGLLLIYNGLMLIANVGIILTFPGWSRSKTRGKRL
jgi:hypothetical protein